MNFNTKALMHFAVSGALYMAALIMLATASIAAYFADYPKATFFVVLFYLATQEGDAHMKKGSSYRVCPEYLMGPPGPPGPMGPPGRDLYSDDNGVTFRYRP